MSARSSWLGRLFRTDPLLARAYVERVIRRNRGVMRNIAFELGFDRRYTFRIIWRENLWPVLDEVRAAHAAETSDENAWLARTRKALAP